MEPIKNSHLNKSIAKNMRAKSNISEKNVEFVINRYFYYAIPAMLHGYAMSGFYVLKISLKYILYSMIPKRIWNRFTYSNKMFGYTFLPDCDKTKLEKYGYNFKPSKKLLEQISAHIENGNVIYTLMQR